MENSFLDADAITQSLFYGLEDKELLLYDSKHHRVCTN